MANNSRVYFFGTDHVLKVGISEQIRKRFDTLKCKERDLRHILDFPGDQLTEGVFLSLFSPWRIYGEWFQFSEPVRRAVRMLERGETDWVPRPWATRGYEPGRGAQLRKAAVEMFGSEAEAISAMSLTSYGWKADGSNQLSIQMGIEVAKRAGRVPAFLLNDNRLTDADRVRASRDFIWAFTEHPKSTWEGIKNAQPSDAANYIHKETTNG